MTDTQAHGQLGKNHLAFLRGLPFGTYALRGEGGLKKLMISAYNSTDRLRELRTRGGRGSKIPKILRTY